MYVADKMHRLLLFSCVVLIFDMRITEKPAQSLHVLYNALQLTDGTYIVTLFHIHIDRQSVMQRERSNSYNKKIVESSK